MPACNDVGDSCSYSYAYYTTVLHYSLQIQVTAEDISVSDSQVQLLASLDENLETEQSTSQPHTHHAPTPVQHPTAPLTTSLEGVEDPSDTGTTHALPPYQAACHDLRIGSWSAQETHQIITSAYSETVHFRPNLFPVPSGSVGSRFVRTLTLYYKIFGDKAAGEGLALKAAMTVTQFPAATTSSPRPTSTCRMPPKTTHPLGRRRH